MVETTSVKIQTSCYKMINPHVMWGILINNRRVYNMTDEERREYDRVRHKKYYEEHKAERQEYGRNYYQKNKEKFLKRSQDWRKEHPEEYKERNSKWNKKYWREHKEERMEYQKEYREKNADELRKKRVQKYEENHDRILSDEFREKSRKQWRSYYAKNKKEIVKKGCIIRKKENDESKEYASQHCHRWTSEEVEILISMVSEGETYKDIAYTLGRTFSSISSKIKKLRKAGIME